MKTTIAHLSDSHLFHTEDHDWKPPKADILVHSGDLTFEGTVREMQDAYEWLKSLPHKIVIFVAGNHDQMFEKSPEMAQIMMPKKLIYLQDSGIQVRGLNFWGSPWTRRFEKWSFQIDDDGQARSIWSRIPMDTDILITHGPSYGILDRTFDGLHVGCQMLQRTLEKRDILLHLFGHIHPAHGKAKVGKTWYSNGSMLDKDYQATHPINVFEVDTEKRTVIDVV